MKITLPQFYNASITKGREAQQVFADALGTVSILKAQAIQGRRAKPGNVKITQNRQTLKSEGTQNPALNRYLDKT